MENPNEKTNPEREFEICIGYRLSRIANVKTDNYIDSVDEDGCLCTDASMNDWQKEYEIKYMTPVGIFEALRETLPSIIDHHYDVWRNTADKEKSAAARDTVQKLQRVWNSLCGWNETFEEAYEV